MKVYLLTEGSYSDYRVNVAFRNKADADAVAATEDSYFDVEEYDLLDEVPVRRMLYAVHADRRPLAHRGRTSEVEGGWTSEVEGGWRIVETQRLVWPWDCAHPKNLRAKITSKASSAAKFDNLWFSVEGWDGEACRKVAFDTITKLKAIQGGISDQ
jgi:hypothetical protein